MPRPTFASTSGVRNLRSVLLLAGGVRRGSLGQALGRPLVDLPVPRYGTMLGAWGEQVSGLAKMIGGPIQVRAMVSQQLQLPRAVKPNSGVEIIAEYDKGEFRGTGGLLRDVTDEYEDDDFVLVGTANQVLMKSLSEIFEVLRVAQAAGNADVVLLSEPDGSASGFMLIRCACLRGIRGNGYLDFKEQSLPQIAKEFVVKVTRCPRRAALPVRTLEQYIRMLRVLHTGDMDLNVEARIDPYEEEWTATFGMVDETASVAKGAIVHDSVVMRNARVGANAVLVRSLVCEGASVAAGQVVFDSVIGSEGMGDDARFASRMPSLESGARNAHGLEARATDKEAR